MVDGKLNLVWYDDEKGVWLTAPVTGHEEHRPGDVMFLNALPISAFKVILTTRTARIRIELVYVGNYSDPTVQELINKTIKYNNVVSYISHESTAKLIGVQPNKGIYTAKCWDKGLIFVLAKPMRNPQDQSVSPSDVDVYFYEVMC